MNQKNQKKEMTINDAIIKILESNNEPLTSQQIYEKITSKKLYNFLAKDPLHIVQHQLRRHCFEINFPSASNNKYFHLVDGNKFSFLRPGKSTKNANPGRKGGIEEKKDSTKNISTVETIRLACREYKESARNEIISSLRKLSPRQFEIFAKILLREYGFEEMVVTKATRDGGIDGNGQLRIGISYLNVAYQCKHWSKTVDRPEIDKFRGAIQGEYEQGLFFITSRFTDGAIAASRKPGAVPITLFDAGAIVDIMFEKQFGVQMESIQIPIPALDTLEL